MPYQFLEDVATADVAFEATGANLEELFKASAGATINTMVDSLDSVLPEVTRKIRLKNPELDLLLFEFLQELVYFKDAEGLLLLPIDVGIYKEEKVFILTCTAAGEEIDPARHEQRADVKAVTLHRFELRQTSDGWKAIVILDV
jgi:SHS2 domain-containing protein